MREAVFLDTGKGKIFSIVHRPDGCVRCPVVLFFHGFTGHHIEAHFMFARMSRMLERENIGSVRFDFRGSGNSDLDFSEMTVFTELEDAEIVLNYVKNLEWVNDEKIGVVGLSMGGVVASLLAEKRGKDIEAICLWAPALKNREVFLSKAQERGVDEHSEIWDVGGVSISKTFLESILSFDAWEKLKGYEGKVMIVHGTGDETVPFSHSEEISRRFGFELVRIEGADHVFSSERWLKELFESTLSFFKRTLKG